MSKTLTIIIPAYNEEASLSLFLPQVINHCEKNGYQLIVIDDGSSDNTKEVLESCSPKSEVMRVITHKVNRGYGGAIKSGIHAAHTDYVITFDADGQHLLSDVDALFSKIQATNADMIIGSRKGHKPASIFRGVGKSIIRMVAKMLMALDVHDLNSGMKIYDAGLGRKYLHFCPNSMPYSDTIALVFINFKHLVSEHPISINERTSGNSTININTAVDTIHQIIGIVLLFNPLKVFIPLSLMALIPSIVWGTPIILRGDGVSIGTMLGITLSVLILILGLIAEQISLLRKEALG